MNTNVFWQISGSDADIFFSPFWFCWYSGLPLFLGGKLIINYQGCTKLWNSGRYQQAKIIIQSISSCDANIFFSFFLLIFTFTSVLWNKSYKILGSHCLLNRSILINNIWCFFLCFLVFYSLPCAWENKINLHYKIFGMRWLWFLCRYFIKLVAIPMYFFFLFFCVIYVRSCSR